MPGTVGWGTDREHGKPPPEQGVAWLDDLDFGQVLLDWVIEGGTEVSGRLTTSATTTYFKPSGRHPEGNLSDTG